MHNTAPLMLLGFSSLVLALALSYFLVQRAHQVAPVGAKGQEPTGS